MKRLRVKNKKKFNRFIIMSFAIFTLLIYIFISLVLPNKAVGSNQEKSFTVLKGDNVWDIAEAMNANKDTRQVVYDIYKLNNISDKDTIYPGQILKLPIY